MRCIFARKSGSADAFQVVVACQDTPPSRRVRRSVSRLIAATVPRSSRWSRSLDNDQVENAVMPQSAGAVRAIRQIRSRIASPIVRLRPPLHFGSGAANPRS
nr:hypothetical protein [Saccharothrix syringae]